MSTPQSPYGAGQDPWAQDGGASQDPWNRGGGASQDPWSQGGGAGQNGYGQSSSSQGGYGQGEHHREPDVTGIEERGMDGHERILQDRVQGVAFDRGRRQALERA